MKTPLLIASVFFLACSDKTTDTPTSAVQPDSSASERLQSGFQCNPPDTDRLIVRSDTVTENNTNTDQIIRYYDAKGRRVKTVAMNVFESNAENIHCITHSYDTAGHMIYESKRLNRTPVYCYTYLYDSKGNLLRKD